MTTLLELFGARTALIIADAIDDADRVPLDGFTRYALIDRGSYDVLEHPAAPVLIGKLIARAERATGRSLVLAEARVLRLGPGDYLLAHHDRVYDGHPLELIADLSPAAVPGAEVHYRRRGQVYFRVPSAPRSMAIVERGPTASSNHTYVSKRFPDARVIRLVVLLRDRESR